MYRRKFIGCLVTAGAALLAPRWVWGAKKRVAVTEFGADPSGKAESNRAVHEALAALSASGGTLVFPHGRYRFAPTAGSAMLLEHANGIEIDGDGSTLLFSGAMNSFQFTGCSDISVHDLSVDWDPLPFTQGTVAASSERWFEVNIDPGHLVPADQPIAAFGNYDREHAVPAANFVDAYGAVDKVVAAGPRRVRLQLNRSMSLPVGAAAVLRLPMSHAVAVLASCRSVNFSRVHIYASPGAGIVGTCCRDMNLDTVEIAMPAGSGRLMSTCADAMHFNGASGTLAISHCRFHGMGDDAININAPFWKVVRRIDPRTIQVQAHGDVPVPAASLPVAGDRIQFVSGKDLGEIGQATVSSVANVGSSTQLQFAETVPAGTESDTLVADLNQSPRATVSNCDFLGNRARGVVAHRDIEIADCRFSRCSMAGVLIAPDSIWMEGPTTRNVNIRKNQFDGCHYAQPPIKEGTIVIDVMHTFSRRVPIKRAVNQGIQITDNIINGGTTAISCRAATDVAIEGNRIGQSAPRQAGPLDAIILDTITNAQVANNVASPPGTIALADCDRTVVLRNNQGLKPVVAPEPRR